MIEGPPTKPPAEEGSRRFGALEAGLWMLGTLLAFSLVVMLLGAVLPGALRDLVTLGGLSSAMFLLASAVLLAPGQGRSVGLAFRSVPIWVISVSLLLGALSQIPARRIAIFVESIAPTAPAELAERAQMLRPASPSHGIMLTLILVLLVPVGEEVFFRGAIFGALRQGGKTLGGACIISGFGFLLSHMEPKLWPALALVALILTAVRGLSGSLVPGLAFHVGFNGFAVLDATWGVFGPDEHWMLSGMPEVWLSLLLLFGLSVLFWRLLRAPTFHSYRLDDEGRGL